MIHKGWELDWGHYVALTKRENVWYEFDDSWVYEVTGDKYTDNVLNKEAYMLFYKMVRC